MMVEEVLTRWPQTAEVFKRRNMACMGCPVSHLYSITEAAGVYELTVDDFVRELEQAINSDTDLD